MTRAWFLFLATVCVWVLGGASAEEAQVTLKGVHLRCGSCKKAVNEGAASAGAKATINADKSVLLTAKDAETLQKALDAIAANGVHGTSDQANVKIKDDSGAPDGKVSKLTVSGAHLCCGGCVKSVQAALGKLEGVKANTAKVGKEPFEVTGDFDAHAAVKALNDAGFHVKVK